MSADPIGAGLKAAEVGGKLLDRLSGVAVVQVEVRQLKEVQAELHARTLKTQEQVNFALQKLVELNSRVDAFLKIEGETRKLLMEAAFRNLVSEKQLAAVEMASPNQVNPALGNDGKRGVS